MIIKPGSLDLQTNTPLSCGKNWFIQRHGSVFVLRSSCPGLILSSSCWGFFHPVAFSVAVNFKTNQLPTFWKACRDLFCQPMSRFRSKSVIAGYFLLYWWCFPITWKIARKNHKCEQGLYIMWFILSIIPSELVSEYDQEIPQSQTADKPMAPWGRASQQSRDTRKTN